METTESTSKQRKKSRLSLQNKTEKSKIQDGAGQSSITSFLKTKNVGTSKLKAKQNKVIVLKNSSDDNTNDSLKAVEACSSKDEHETDMTEPSKMQKNAFTFMMHNRYKSIGQNSPGKEGEEIEESDEAKLEKKRTLLCRRRMFEEWAERKGGKKRKVEDVEKGIIIEKKLRRRAKRLRKMLSINETADTKDLKEDDQHITINSTDHKNGPKIKVKNTNCHKENVVESKAIYIKDTNSTNKNFKIKGTNTRKEEAKKMMWRMKLKVNLTDEEAKKLVTPQENVEKFIDVNLNKVNGKKASKVIYTDSGDKSNKQDSKKHVKVAPVFKMSNQKSKEETAAIMARKEFLHSDVPAHIKKVIQKQDRNILQDYEVYPSISHVVPESNLRELELMNSGNVELKLKSIDQTIHTTGMLTKGSITNLRNTNNIYVKEESKNVRNVKQILKRIKEENSDYPVYKIYKYLYKKYISHQKLDNDVEVSTKQFQMWTDLYKPSSSQECFGNCSAISEIKTWLKTWIEFGKTFLYGTHNNHSNSSDFETTDEDSRDRTETLPGTTLILSGPHGCGKTMAVYAISNEFGIDVLEINASSKRTGKKLLMSLQEATQSHQVGKNENAMHSFLQKSESNNLPLHNKTKVKICLLLIEDVDVVFEQDDGFINSLFQLSTTSKRPIILTTTNSNCLHLQKFSSLFPVIEFGRLSERILAPWLQLTCLVEGSFVSKDSILTMLENNNFDARSTLLQLQFWVQSAGQSYVLESQVNKEINNTRTMDEYFCQDDSSSSSFLEEGGELGINAVQRICSKPFKKQQLYDLNLLWWNFDLSQNCNSTKDVLSIYEAFAAADMLYQKFYFPQQGIYKFKQVITDSLELSESEESYTLCHNTSWMKTLITGYLNKSQNKIGETFDKGCYMRQMKSNEALIEVVPLAYQLQHDSVSLDYLTTLRTINRTETQRASKSSKRRSRFYHYLRGLGLSAQELSLSRLSSIFCLENM
ncbi:hypothetical protein FQA39_LY03256 [Lamprigera yunnana]|nr:hypothetical protein FQA39_LY03256 [Lamprigera yunnana]